MWQQHIDNRPGWNGRKSTTYLKVHGTVEEIPGFRSHSSGTPPTAFKIDFTITRRDLFRRNLLSQRVQEPTRLANYHACINGCNDNDICAIYRQYVGNILPYPPKVDFLMGLPPFSPSLLPYFHPINVTAAVPFNRVKYRRRRRCTALSILVFIRKIFQYSKSLFIIKNFENKCID